jgi:hypothetical protein
MFLQVSLCYPKSIGQVRVEYHSKDQIGRNKWVLNYIRNNKVIRDNNVSCGIRWHIDKFDVCYRCWKLPTGISTYKMQQYQRFIGGNSGVSKMKSNIQTALAWLETTYQN